MFRRLFGLALIVASGWTDLDRCAAAQTTPAANSNAAVTFALFPLGRPAHLPIEIEGLVLDGKLLNFDEPLLLPPDWPAHLSIRLRNVSSQPITYIMLDLSFPESGAANRPPYGAQVHLGNLIPARTRNQFGDQVTRQQVDPLTWLQKDEVTISLRTISGTLAAAERLHQPISRILVSGPIVQFQNVSLWNTSYYHCEPDGSHCVNASYEEFLPR
jgi:hypothetical protein